MAQTAPGEASGRHAPRSWRAFDALLLVVAVALLVTTGVLLVGQPSGGAQEAGAEELSQRHEEVTEAAGAEAVAFLTVDHRDMESVADDVLAGATGEFREDYVRDRAGLVSRARKARALASAETVAVGVDSLAERSAVVLVAADQKVRNAATSGRPQRRIYRLELTLERQHGAWLTSRLRVVG